MNRYYFADDLRVCHSHFFKHELLPKMRFVGYCERPFWILLPNQSCSRDWQHRFLDEGMGVMTDSITSFHQFKRELFRAFRWNCAFEHFWQHPSFLYEKSLTSVQQQMFGQFFDSSIKNLFEQLSYIVSLDCFLDWTNEYLDIVEWMNQECLMAHGFTQQQNVSNIESWVQFIHRVPRFLDESFKALLSNKELFLTQSIPQKWNLVLQFWNEYNQMKQKQQFIDENDADQISLFFLNQIIHSAKPLPVFLKKISEIYCLHMDNLSLFDLKLIQALSQIGIPITLSGLDDKIRKRLFSKGKRIRLFLEESGFDDCSKQVNSFTEENGTVKRDSLLVKITKNILPDDLTQIQKYSIASKKHSVIRIQAETIEAEIIEVARVIKHLLVEQASLPLHDIAVVVPKIDFYRDMVDRIFDDYGIPISRFSNKKIKDFKLTQDIFKILYLRLQLDQWQLDTDDLLIECLESSYFYLAASDVDDSFEKDMKKSFDTTQTRVCVKEIKKIRVSLMYRGTSLIDYLKLEQENTASLEQQTNKLNLLYRYIQAWLKYISALPGVNQPKSIYESSLYFKSLLMEQFSLLYNIYKGSDLVQIQQDSIVWQQFLDILTQLSYSLVESNIERLSIQEYISILEQRCQSVSLSVTDKNSGYVQCSEAANMLGKSYRYVFLLGLYEGAVPHSYSKSSLFSDSQRSLLQKKYEENEFLQQQEWWFYLSCLSCSDVLFVCFPEKNQHGKRCLPSFFLDEIEDALDCSLNSLPDAHSLGINSFLYNQDEAYAYLAEEYRLQLHHSSVTSLAIEKSLIDARHLDGYLLNLTKDNIRIDVLAQSDKLSEYEGCLELDSGMQGEFIDFYLNNSSVTSFERYGNCPHQHFFQDVLRLYASAKVEQLERMDQGQIWHQVLHDLYQKNDEWIDADDITLKTKVECLINEKLELFLGTMHPRLTYYQFILKKKVPYLVSFCRNDLEERNSFVFHHLEEKFDQNLDDLIPQIHLRAKIDRIDFDSSKKQCRIIDYKTGEPKSKEEILNSIHEGVLFQPLLYSELVQKRYPEYQIQSWNYYYPLYNNSKTKVKKVLFNLSEQKQKNGQILSLRDIFLNNLLEYLQLAKEALFPVIPKELGLCDYCSFRSICRIRPKNQTTKQRAWEKRKVILQNSQKTLKEKL